MLLLTSLMSACLGESPEDKLRAEQGSAPDGDEEHRPGQPCLVCHSAGYNPGGSVFVLGGTIFERASNADNQGLEGARVNFQDAEGHEFTAITNRTGNFMVEVKSDLTNPEQWSRGRLKIPWEPVFPLTVAVVSNGVDKSMESQIWREGSCATCHYSSETGVDHVEKVWHTEPTQ